jgi:hypothetical protein
MNERFKPVASWAVSRHLILVNSFGVDINPNYVIAKDNPGTRNIARKIKRTPESPPTREKAIVEEFKINFSATAASGTDSRIPVVHLS